VREGQTLPAPSQTHWLRVVLVVGVLLALVTLAVVQFRSPPPIVQAPELPARPVAQDAQQAELSALLAGYACAHLEATFSDAKAVTIRGHVREEDLTVLMDAVDKLGGLNNVTYEVEALPWPFCEAATLIARAAPLRFEASAQLRAGDPVVAEIEALREPAFVYVDLYRVDGSVVHVYPESAQNNLRVAPGVALVSGKSPLAWRVQAPYGDAMLVVLAARESLSVASARSEPAQDYLANLYRVLNTGGPLLGAQYRMVTTEPKS